MSVNSDYEVIIIGGGISGMVAALYCARANHKSVILESNITGGLANWTYIIENFPSYKEVHGMELMQKIREQIDFHGVAVEEVCEIESMSLEGDIKRIVTSEGTYEAKAVIISTGRQPIHLDVPTECPQTHYCSICDGAGYKGKKVLVVGGGNSAFDESLYMLQLGVAHITLVEKMDRFFAAASTQDNLLKRDNVNAYNNCVVNDLEVKDGKLVAAILEDIKTGSKNRVEVDGVFVFLGQNPNSKMFSGIIDMDKQGYIVVDENMQTNIPGVFSAGDVNAKAFRQLTTAAADGTIAALMVDRFLRSK